MVKLDFHVPIDSDLEFIAENMRADDVAEVLAAGNESPLEALVSSVKHSKAVVVASYEGAPLVIYGLVKPSILSTTGIIWMLGTNQSLDYPREFMVYTRRVLKEMLLECDELTNYVHDENVRSIKWLKALGFTMDDRAPHGPFDAMFRKFYMKRES